MTLLENFKEQIYIDNISKTIIGKVGSLPRNWGFPQFMLNDEKFIKKFFGEKAYNFYSQMSDLEKKEARDWFERSGGEILDQIGGTSWEEDDENFHMNFVQFHENLPKIYPEVVQIVVPEIFPNLPGQVLEEVIKDYIKNPKNFQKDFDKTRK
jgi:hypothetical protein